ncbi:MAG: DUF4138 domain-containing protein [Sediminibacterium sp.]
MTTLFAKGQSYIRPRNLQVTINKTTNLIFPASISSVDRGSERIVVQKSTGNILRVKADSVFNDTTNLTVITSDGKLYSFLVGYSASPTFLNLDLSAIESVNKDTALYALSEKTLQAKNNLHGIRYTSGKVKLSLVGLYTTGSIIICKLRIENASPYSFETGQMRCYVGGSNSSKRRPSQQTELEPLLINPLATTIKEKQVCLLTMILPKAGLRVGQNLVIQLNEKIGERQLSVSVSNKDLLAASIIH